MKLADLEVDWPGPVAALRIEIEFDDGDADVLFKAIEQVITAANRRQTS